MLRVEPNSNERVGLLQLLGRLKPGPTELPCRVGSMDGETGSRPSSAKDRNFAGLRMKWRNELEDSRRNIRPHSALAASASLSTQNWGGRDISGDNPSVDTLQSKGDSLGRSIYLSRVMLYCSNFCSSNTTQCGLQVKYKCIADDFCCRGSNAEG